MTPDTLIVVAARDEAARIAATVRALAVAFPGAPVWVADDGSVDATPALARATGATVVRRERGASRREGAGKGQAMTAGVEAALSSIDFFEGRTRVRVRAREYGDSEHAVSAPPASVTAPGSVIDSRADGPASGPDPRPVARSPADGPGSDPVVILCDGDLGDSARELRALADTVRRGEADLVVAAFSARIGGGFGFARGFARWAIRRRCGLATRAPLSGQRALRAGVLRDVLPFAPGFGMEIGMTIDAVRAGHRVAELELDLTHRATGRTPAGFAHRARQLADVVWACLARR